MIIPQLKDILQYYVDTFGSIDDIDSIYEELIINNVEVKGNSFYCPIWKEEVNAYVLLAGTKDNADLWVLKRIIKLIKSGQVVYTMFNGNSDYLIKQFGRYDIQVISRDRDISYISFNNKKE